MSDRDWKNIEYLKDGNSRQQKAYRAVRELKVLETLKAYDPVVVGTIPIEIDTETSDIDIICEVNDINAFESYIIEHFGNRTGFKCYRTQFDGYESVVSKFLFNRMPFEIFGQGLPVERQNAYRHMIVEYRLLRERGSDFKKRILQLKRQGIKTEPAFAKVLGLNGDPYMELLKFER